VSDPDRGNAGSAPADGEPVGLVQSVRDLVGMSVAALQTRLELLSADAQEAGWRLAAIVVFGVAALFCLFVGTVLLALLVIVAFWDRSPTLAVGLLSAVFLLASAGCAWLARGHVRRSSGLFAATLDTLARDRERLDRRSAATAAEGSAGPAAPR
jgi:uncharacterized membrane protein YqjE